MSIVKENDILEYAESIYPSLKSSKPPIVEPLQQFNVEVVDLDQIEMKKLYEKAKETLKFLTYESRDVIETSNISIFDLLVKNLDELMIVRKIRESKQIRDKANAKRLLHRADTLSKKFLNI